MGKFNKFEVDPKTFRRPRREGSVIFTEEVRETPKATMEFQPALKTKGFEVRELGLSNGAVTPEYLHNKKTRSYFVVSGICVVDTSKEFDDEDGVVQVSGSSTTYTTGSHIYCEAGTSYRLAASGGDLRLLEVQDAKYSTGLKQLSPALPGVDGTVFITNSVPVSAPSGRRKKTKASNQAVEVAQRKAQHQGKASLFIGESTLPANFVPEGINLAPEVFT